MYLRQNRSDSLYPYSVNILLSRKRKNTNSKIKKMFLLLFFICLFLLFYFIFSSKAHAFNLKKSVKKGKQIVIQSGCVKCHSFIKDKRIDNIKSLAGWGNKHFSIKQTEKAIRSCKMDPYCSEILSNKQVKYVAYYLNSLK
jgi:cytochrome c553